MKRPLLLAAALLLAACNTRVDPQFRVKDLRVLAVRSGVTAGLSADVSAGDLLVLDALVANPLARPGLEVAWFACLPEASDAVSPCADLATLNDPTRLPALASGANPSVLFLGNGASVQLRVPALTDALAFVVAQAQRERSYACRVYAEIVVVVVATAGGKHALAYKSVKVLPSAAQVAAAGVTSHYTFNNNPVIDPSSGGVFFAPTDADACSGGTPLTSGTLPAGKTVLCGRAGPRAPDTYEYCDPDGRASAALESLSWQWYVTDGDFPEVGGVGNARGDHVDFVRPAGAFTLWAILRDGRGGDDWVTVGVPAP